MLQRRLFVYNDWANREELSRLRELTVSPAPALRIFSHIIAAEWLWLARLGWSAAKMDVWPELTLTQCSVELDWLRDAWRAMLRDVDPTAVVEYRNSRGEIWTNVIDDILTHVPLHGSYHRGQIATQLRATGGAPPYTDFIHAARSGLLNED